MRTLGNILWHVPFLGFVNAILTWLVGLLLTATIILSPVGLGLMELGKFLFAPFTRAMVSRKALGLPQNEAWRAYSVLIMILYFPFGLILAIVTILHIAALFVSIVGIPVALVLAKSLGTIFNPINKTCVPLAVAQELEMRAARAEVNRHLGPDQR